MPIARWLNTGHKFILKQTYRWNTLFQNIEHPSPSPPGESVLPPPLLRGEDRLAGRRGGWEVIILEEERNRIALLQWSLYVYGAFPDWGPLAEDSAAKLKRSQLSVCTVCVYCVRCTLFPLVAEICARLAGNFCQYFTTLSCWANSLVWVAVCYFTAS